MSDIRTKLLVGTSIAAVAMMLALVSGMEISTSDVSVSETQYKLLGHATLVAVNPDGTTSYSQSDNIILIGGRDAAALRLFGTGSTTAPFVCIELGDGPTPGVEDIDTGNDVPLTNSNVECDAFSGEATAATTGNNPNEFTIDATITIANGDGPTDITEVALGNGTGGSPGLTGALSHFALATAIPVVDGTVVTVTYTMSTT